MLSNLEICVAQNELAPTFLLCCVDARQASDTYRLRDYISARRNAFAVFAIRTGRVALVRALHRLGLNLGSFYPMQADARQASRHRHMRSRHQNPMVISSVAVAIEVGRVQMVSLLCELGASFTFVSYISTQSPSSAIQLPFEMDAIAFALLHFALLFHTSRLVYLLDVVYPDLDVPEKFRRHAFTCPGL